MEADPLARGQRRCALEKFEVDIERRRWREHTRRRHHHSAFDIGKIHALKVQRGALAGARFVDHHAVHLHTTHTRGLAVGEQLDLVVAPHAPGDQRPGRDWPEPLHREAAIDRQAQHLLRVTRCHRRRHRTQRLDQRRDAFAGAGTYAKNRRLFEKRSLQELLHVDFHQVRHPGFDRIDLGQHREAALHPQQRADRDVFPGLRHHRLFSRDHQQHDIDAADARQHVLDETFMPRHVDEAERRLIVEGQTGKAEIDGDPALLLLLQAVGVGPSQRFDERSLAVIDVPGGADDDVGHSGINCRISA